VKEKHLKNYGNDKKNCKNSNQILLNVDGQGS